MYGNYSLKKIILTIMYAAVLVWLILLGFEWGSTYFENQKQAAYEEVPFELKLKTEPKDVIYSEAYETASGDEVVKYAYLTDEVSPILGEDVTKRTPVSQTVVLDTFKNEEGKSMEKLKTTFLSKPQMYQDGGKWRQIEYATTTAEVFSMSGVIPHIKRRELAEKIIPGESVFAAVSTFYPDANTETTSVDGQVLCARGQPDPDLAYADAVGDSCTSRTPNDSSVQVVVGDGVIETTPGISWEAKIWRGFFLFDTSSLGTSATISSATLSLYLASSGYTIAGLVNIYSSNPGVNTLITGTDYNTVGTTQFATSIGFGSLTGSAYNAFSLNSSGLTNISKTSISKFSARVDNDYNSTSPGYDTTNQLFFASADTTGTSQDPKLEVTYTVPSTFSMGQWFPF